MCGAVAEKLPSNEALRAVRRNYYYKRGIKRKNPPKLIYNTVKGGFFVKRWLRVLAGCTAVCALMMVCRFESRCAGIRESVVRLHVLANSDSVADQALKLKVRDAVTQAGAGLLDGVTSRTQAVTCLAQALPLLQQTAQQCVRENGYTYPVSICLGNEYFSTRTYECGTFPAGYYKTVRINIGEGNGKNWWCVMYPPLCVPAATDSATLSDVLTDEQCRVVEQAPRYAVRFKLVEWFTALVDFLTS